MKNIFYLFLIVLITTSENIKSQEINPLDFFPHHVGDLWQYFNHTQAGSEFWEKRITDIDTIWTDSSKIITFNYRNSYDILHKIYFSDSLTVYWKTFGDWGIRYRFNVPLNTFWLSDPYFPYYTKYVNEGEELVFDDTLSYREYWTAPDTLFILSLWNERLALGIGEFYREFEVGITVLIGCIINGVQYGTIISVDDQNSFTQPAQYLLNNFPNPFNNQTNIHYFIPVSSYVTITIFDILGREVKKLFDGEETAGHYYRTWKPNDGASGLYFIVLRTEKTQLTHKILYLK
ncbi:MAG TPA: T9SS type A sorting domain-containing protein [Ignavibacteriaceae bacterium]|nr:T9SS type A sorting domain-containing protein [Ignavibacteriaceae bacterium]